MRFTVLGSGSGGNASLIEAGGFGVLIDIGLGPRQLASRLVAAGRSWSAVHMVLLTHTHSDHWKEATLGHLLRRRIPLYCHASHHTVLQTYSASFPSLSAAGLVHSFDPNSPCALTPSLRCVPLPVCHDGGATFGFRFESDRDLFGHAETLAYLADLGSWDDNLVRALANVDLLAIEFNHDIHLQHSSGRTPRLIARVLGDEGHLSNCQAAKLLRAVLAQSDPGRLRYLIQLHLSQECNRPALAQEAAQRVLDEMQSTAELHTAAQNAPCASLSIEEGPARRPRRASSRRSPANSLLQPLLPGFDRDSEQT